MYCVIQELNLRKANTNGAYKQLGVFISPFNTRNIPQYGYCDEDDQFERPIKKAYKISVHESKRVNGVVTKKQFVVTTVDYYTFAKDLFALGDYGKKIAAIAEKLNADENDVYAVVDEKVALLQKRIQAEFEQTEEYITDKKHKEIIAQYQKEKSLFSRKYSCPENEYDCCFNVFGELMNESYFNKIKKGSKERRSYYELLEQ